MESEDLRKNLRAARFIGRSAGGQPAQRGLS
jgi:hypothetical protein